MSDLTKKISYDIGINNNWKHIKKPIIAILVNNSKDHRENYTYDFIGKKLADLKILLNKYVIIVRPHPLLKIKQKHIDILGKNFIVDTNVSFIPLMDRADIIISYELTSCLDCYALWKRPSVPILLVYSKVSYNKLKSLMNTDRVINNRCCVIQVEGSENIVKGVDDAIKMDKNNVDKYRDRYINTYFYRDEKNANYHYLRNILTYIDNIKK